GWGAGGGGRVGGGGGGGGGWENVGGGRRRWARPRGGGGHGGHDRRAGCAGRGSRPGGSNHHLRARRHDRLFPHARAQGSTALMTSNAERRAAQQRELADALAERLDTLLDLRGDERVLDVGAGTGAFAFAVADRVREVVAV